MRKSQVFQQIDEIQCTFDSDLILWQRMKKKEAELKKQKQIWERLDRQYQQTKSQDRSYGSLELDAAQHYKQKLINISQKVGCNGLQTWPQFKVERNAEIRKYKGMKNEGQEAIAQILLQLGLIQEISQYSLNELVVQAMKNQKYHENITQKMPNFISNIEELRDLPDHAIVGDSDLLEYSDSCNSGVDDDNYKINYHKQSNQKQSNHIIKPIQQPQSIKFSFIDPQEDHYQLKKSLKSQKSIKIPPQQSQKQNKNPSSKTIDPKILLYHALGRLTSIHQQFIIIYKESEQQYQTIPYSRMKEILLMKKKTNFKLITNEGFCYRIHFQHRKQFQQICNKFKKGYCISEREHIEGGNNGLRVIDTNI